jgi:HAMP domain-containing protein/putative methionine-R-sulfoxide reductase with GAF domain
MPGNSIRRKLQGVFLIFVLFGVISCGIFYYYTNRISEYRTTSGKVDKLRILTLEARKFENNFITYDTRSDSFMATGVSQNLQQHQLITEEIKELLDNLQQNNLVKNTATSLELESIKKSFEEYSRLFIGLTKLVKQRGYRDFGLEGEMRNAIHNLENGSSINKVTILMLRRHEKDFFLRKDTTYISQLEKVAASISLTETDKSTLWLYLDKFAKIVALEKQIGLTEKTGDKGKMLVLAEAIDAKVAKINQNITNTTSALVQESVWIMTIAALILLTIAGISAFSFAYRLAKPVIELDRITRSVVQNGIADQDKELDTIDSKDEIGNLAKDFKLMLIQLKNHILEIDRQNEQLKVAALAESKRAWRNEGLVKVEDILRLTSSLSRFNELIFALVRHLEAHQGAIYVVENNGIDPPVLKLKAYFAGKNQENSIIRQGEGLIGEVWRKKEVILLKDLQIPGQYSRVAAGLGYITPKNLLIVPIIAEPNVEGVIEIASLYEIADYEVEFVKRAALQIAMILVTAKVNDLNRRLVSTLQKHQVFPSPEIIGGATHEEILELLKRQE